VAVVSNFAAHGTEYAFGAHDQSSSGVFEVEPRNCPGFIFRDSILIGNTDMNPQQFREFVENRADYYNGDTYHLIVKNCNHFTSDLCSRLTGKEIPSWVNRLARIGTLYNFSAFYRNSSHINIFILFTRALHIYKTDEA
jgi:hypothetical protein